MENRAWCIHSWLQIDSISFACYHKTIQCPASNIDSAYPYLKNCRLNNKQQRSGDVIWPYLVFVNFCVSCSLSLTVFTFTDLEPSASFYSFPVSHRSILFCNIILHSLSIVNSCYLLLFFVSNLINKSTPCLAHSIFWLPKVYRIQKSISALNHKHFLCST